MGRNGLFKSEVKPIKTISLLTINTFCMLLDYPPKT